MYMQDKVVKDSEYELCTKEAAYCNDQPYSDEEDDDDFYNMEDTLREEL